MGALVCMLLTESPPALKDSNAPTPSPQIQGLDCIMLNLSGCRGGVTFYAMMEFRKGVLPSSEFNPPTPPVRPVGSCALRATACVQRHTRGE